MPFSQTTKSHTKEYWDNHFENFLKPLIDSCNEVEAFRSVPLRQDILRQIINDLVFDPLVVADLTDSNPNVYWELGVRLSFRHGTITIANEGSEIPFDIKTKGVLFYPSDSDERDDFAKKVKEAISDCLSNPNRPDSVVLETVTGRGSIYSVIHHQELIQKLDGLIVENQINHELFEAIIMKTLENKGRKLAFIKGKEAMITRLSHAAMDMLLGERFLEEEQDFYIFVHTLRAYVEAVNHNLSTWDYNTSKGIEKWFLDKSYDIKSMIGEYHKKLEDIKQKLLSTC